MTVLTVVGTYLAGGNTRRIRGALRKKGVAVHARHVDVEDDEIDVDFARSLEPRCPGQVRWFSANTRVANGAFRFRGVGSLLVLQEAPANSGR